MSCTSGTDGAEERKAEEIAAGGPVTLTFVRLSVRRNWESTGLEPTDVLERALAAP